MTIKYLKKAIKTPSTDDHETRASVQKILNDLEISREKGIKEISKKFDKYEGEVVVSKEKIEEASKKVNQKTKDDIQFAHERIKKFAEHQLKHLNNDFEVEISKGLIAGQRLIPIDTVGCYIPGGRYAHISSAIMGITPAKVAGVKTIITASPPKDSNGANPGIIYAANLCGADVILNLGGIAAIASLTYGCFENPPVDFLVGAGNQYVAEAKRLLFGKVGIDLFAGPTEIAIIADKNYIFMQHIYIGDEGKGFPLILIHGFLGSSKMWEPQINFFKNHFRVITPDLPGFGKSNKAKSHNSIQSIANLLMDCLEEKKIDKFYLLGHSMGGMIVQEMAKKYGNKIVKLICYSTGPRGEMPGRFESVDQSRENLKKKGLEITVKNIAKTWFVRKENAKYFDICIEAGKQTSTKAADDALIAFKNWNGVDTLKNIKNETLIVWGDQDKSYNLEQIKTLEKSIKKSKLVIFKNCAHNVHLEQPDQFNNTIKNFLL